MIIKNYIIKLFCYYFFLSLFLLVFFTFLVKFIDILSTFESFDVPLLNIFLLFLYILPEIIVSITPICSCIATLILFSEMSLKGEIIATRTAGVHMIFFLQIILKIGIVLALIIFFIHSWLAPWGRFQLREFTNSMKVSQAIAVKPQVPTQLGTYVLYVESKNEDNLLKNIVLTELQKKNKRIIWADTAQLTINNDISLGLKLSQGKIYEYHNADNYSYINFNDLHIPLLKEKNVFHNIIHKSAGFWNDINLTERNDYEIPLNKLVILSQKYDSDSQKYYSYNVEIVSRLLPALDIIAVITIAALLGIFYPRQPRKFLVLKAIGIMFVIYFIQTQLIFVAESGTFHPFLILLVPLIFIFTSVQLLLKL